MLLVKEAFSLVEKLAQYTTEHGQKVQEYIFSNKIFSPLLLCKLNIIKVFVHQLVCSIELLKRKWSIERPVFN